MASILTEIKNSKSKVFRRLYIKRRLASTGLFESTWQNVSTDVKTWGRISKSIDHVRYARVRYQDVNLTMANDYGRYNPEDDEASFWFGYANQQRSLVKIEAGFVHQTQSAGGVWTNTEYPTNSTIFIGVIQGDIPLSDSNDVVIPVKPLLQVFRDFSCRNLTGLTTTGMTANQFITLLRDQTDGSGAYLFRPFFQDTTTNWEFTSSSTVYKDITSTITSAQPAYGTDTHQNDFMQMNVWDALERLAEAENLVPYITREGKFRFASREPNTSTAQFQFYGRGFRDSDYGITIKRIQSYKTKLSDYYSRVEVKWSQLATTTAVVTTQSSMAVGGGNDAWNLGHRTFSVENYWLATQTAAEALAARVFAQVSALPKEIDFLTSFVPHMELLDRVGVSYESTDAQPRSMWDQNDWAHDTVQTDTDLIWSASTGDAIRFRQKEFKLTNIEMNLDSLECRFVGVAL
jgi:hypothetical protein